MSDLPGDTSDTKNDTETVVAQPQSPKQPPKLPKEIGGAPGPEPTRYGDWAHKGRCTDF